MIETMKVCVVMSVVDSKKKTIVCSFEQLERHWKRGVLIHTTDFCSKWNITSSTSFSFFFDFSWMEVDCFVSSLPSSLHIYVKLFRKMSSSSVSMTFLVLRIDTLLQKFCVSADLVSL